MALKATIFKVKLSLSNMDIHFYEDFNLTLARHPSENNLRLMARLIAFILNAYVENLTFTKGLSSDAEPDIWKINHDGSIELWIEMGHLDERRIRQVASKSQAVKIYTYQNNQSLQWFSSIEKNLNRFDNVSVTHLTFPDEAALDELVERGMNITCTIEDGEIWLSSETFRIMVEFKHLRL